MIAIDGTEYFSSSQIHCSNCSTRILKSRETRYFHSVITLVIVCPGQSHVIPLVPQFIVPQDGHDKQDCETAAAKRWLTQQGQRLSEYKNSFATHHTLNDGNVADIVLAGLQWFRHNSIS